MIKPLARRVLIQQIEAKNETPGGIIIPDGAKKKPQKGRVISVGELKKIQIKKDDIVFFVDYAGISIEVGGEEYFVVDEQEIIAIEQGDENGTDS